MVVVDVITVVVDFVIAYLLTLWVAKDSSERSLLRLNNSGKSYTAMSCITNFIVQVASMVDDVDFYIVSKPAVMKEIGANEASIRVMKSFDEPLVEFKETLTKENLKG